MLFHFAANDGNDVLPSQFPLAPPTILFLWKRLTQAEVWKKRHFYTQVCESHKSSLLSSCKKIWKREKKAHTLVSDERGKKKTTRNLLSQWKQAFLCSVISLWNPPTLTKSWTTYLFGQWKMWILRKISSWSSNVPDILVIYGHRGAGNSHNTATLRPTPHLGLLWGQAHSMNKVVL